MTARWFWSVNLWCEKLTERKYPDDFVSPGQTTGTLKFISSAAFTPWRKTGLMINGEKGSFVWSVHQCLHMTLIIANHVLITVV